MFSADLSEVLKVHPGDARMPDGFRGPYVGVGRYAAVTTSKSMAHQRGAQPLSPFVDVVLGRSNATLGGISGCDGFILVVAGHS
ncbi:hypothetical protein [Stenotrophomonas forensis]|nr:hypothetical protein [Stenotrophomonas maltophilia]HEL5004001.1 hypothetical protein [Stenotrophomonas maltophilia]